ncbi:uncharacterized protein LOC116220340 [Clupea harengus]|uniref:Uncharacterized protein LOC116220340 n=1 Tax=Clupea harengus TaxID=7950 RepID=A0A6P8FGE9_CLUHA|nr:uncharacterized protein LOC116220340 [Clupea harengus]
MNLWGDAAALLLLTAVCLSFCAEALEKVEARCHSNVSLPCDAHSQNYRSLTWYKLHSRTSILKRKGGNITTYDYPRAVALGPQGELILPRVTPDDSGTFECLRKANVGGQNQESIINLSVTACIRPTEVMPTPSLLPALEGPLLEGMVVVHAGWAFLGFSSLSLLKIILCFVSVKVFAKVRCSRNQRLGSQRSRRFQVRPRFGGGVVSFIKRVLPWMKELASTEWPHVLFLTPTDGSLLL